MTNFVATIVLFLFSIQVYAQTVMNSEVSSTQSAVTTLYVSLCATTESEAENLALDLSSQDLGKSKMSSKACQSAKKVLKHRQSEYRDFSDSQFRVADYQIEDVKIARQAPNGKTCLNGQLAYQVVHCTVEVNE